MGRIANCLVPTRKEFLILDASGHYAQTQMRADRPKFAINNRLQGTAEENKAIVQRTVAFFGTWTVDEASKVLTMRLDASLFPNQVGEISKRPITIVGDEYDNERSSSGRGRNERDAGIRSILHRISLRSLLNDRKSVGMGDSVESLSHLISQMRNYRRARPVSCSFE